MKDLPVGRSSTTGADDDRDLGALWVVLDLRGQLKAVHIVHPHLHDRHRTLLDVAPYAVAGARCVRAAQQLEHPEQEEGDVRSRAAELQYRGSLLLLLLLD